jgi:hypothetical protein
MVSGLSLVEEFFKRNGLEVVRTTANTMCNDGELPVLEVAIDGKLINPISIKETKCFAGCCRFDLVDPDSLQRLLVWARECGTHDQCNQKCKYYNPTDKKFEQ